MTKPKPSYSSTNLQIPLCVVQIACDGINLVGVARERGYFLADHKVEIVRYVEDCWLKTALRCPSGRVTPSEGGVICSGTCSRRTTWPTTSSTE
jgi:hypothetical protein